ncbi:hypothetical protein ONO86_06460 [Micromonospora noduli]|nr:hypothetical protein ONO86_06460 [Micromonospora noduli]
MPARVRRRGHRRAARGEGAGHLIRLAVHGGEGEAGGGAGRATGRTEPDHAGSGPGRERRVGHRDHPVLHLPHPQPGRIQPEQIPVAGQRRVVPGVGEQVRRELGVLDQGVAVADRQHVPERDAPGRLRGTKVHQHRTRRVEHRPVGLQPPPPEVLQPGRSPRSGRRSGAGVEHPAGPYAAPVAGTHQHPVAVVAHRLGGRDDPGGVEATLGVGSPVVDRAGAEHGVPQRGEVQDAATRRRRHLDLLPARAEQRVQVAVRVTPECPGAVLTASAHRVDDGDPQIPDTVAVQCGEQQRRGAATTEQREVDVERRGVGHPHHAATPSRVTTGWAGTALRPPGRATRPGAARRTRAPPRRG